jgi:hypothetical protein
VHHAAFGKVGWQVGYVHGCTSPRLFLIFIQIIIIS